MDDLLKIARDYLARGWAPIPIPARSKNPGRKGWQRERHTEKTIARAFNGQAQNIGVLLGDPSNGLIDVDLDHLRAIARAAEFLPTTEAKFGRASKRESHWLFRVSAPVETVKHQTATKEMIVELRSTGTQTVFPGSGARPGGCRAGGDRAGRTRRDHGRSGTEPR